MKKIQTLDSLRLIMILTIILSHMEFLGGSTESMNVYDMCFHNAYMGVNYFFLLSGFGLTLSFFNRDRLPAMTNLRSIKNILSYARGKVKNSLLLYEVTMIAMLPYELAHTSGFRGRITIAIKAGVCSTLLQSATGIKGISHAFNGVCWFFSTLFVLYLLYPILETIVSKIVKSKILCTLFVFVDIVIAVAAEYILRIVELNTRFNGLSYESPYSRVWVFLLGILIAYYFYYEQDNKNEKSKKYIKYKEVAIIILFLLYWLTRNWILLYESSGLVCTALDLVIPGYMIYIFAFSEGAISRQLNSNWIVKLSKYSMYFYFIHYPIRMYVEYFDILKIEKVFIILVGTFTLSFIARRIQMR